MANKKGFYAPVIPVYDALRQPDELEAQKAQEAKEALQTQGKRGIKASRINMAFTPSNTDYIKVMAGVRGESMTQFVNAALEEHRQQNGTVYEKAKALIDGVRK